MGVMEKFLLFALFLFSGVQGVENDTSRGRPVKDEKQPVQVIIGLTLQQILNIDVEESSMTGVYWVNIEWVDYYLAWSEDDEAQVRCTAYKALCRASLSQKVV